MKKVLFIHRYGEKWKCSIHFVEDRIAEKALRFSKQRKWGLAYRTVANNDLATERQRMRDDWNSLETIDILLAYFRGWEDAGEDSGRKDFERVEE